MFLNRLILCSPYNEVPKDLCDPSRGRSGGAPQSTGGSIAWGLPKPVDNSSRDSWIGASVGPMLASHDSEGGEPKEVY